MKPVFSPLQKKLLTVCITIYTAAYACRLNLASALGGVMEGLSLSMVEAGMLQTVFAIVYAAGQLVNGAIVDHVNPAKYMLVGLLGTAVCNTAMVFCPSYGALLGVWALNAAFQSMMWTPIMRILALYFRDPAARLRANEAVAMMLIVGHFAAWAISAFLSERAGWQVSFVVPAMIALAAFLCSAPSVRGLDVSRQESAVKAERLNQEARSTLFVLASTGFFPVLLTCVLFGFIRDGVITWTPTILTRMSGSEGDSAALFTLILPAINMAGVKAGFILRQRGSRPYGVVLLMMAAAALSCVLLSATGAVLMTAVLLGVMCAGMYGANTMLTGLIPQEYDRIGKTSMTAGLIDSFIYMGSALAGAFAGGLYESRGVVMLYGAWLASAAVSAAMMHISGGMSRRYWKDN